MIEPMTAERRAEIRERITRARAEVAQVSGKGWFAPGPGEKNSSAALINSGLDGGAELLTEIDRLRALWAAVAKTSQDRKAEADGRRQHNQRLEDELATRTTQLELRDAEIRRLRTLVDKAEQTLPIEQRRLLAISRMVFDHIAAGRPFTRDEAGDLAQRIVDEIGHSVTDEPALGPSFRAEIERLNAEVRAAMSEQHVDEIERIITERAALPDDERLRVEAADAPLLRIQLAATAEKVVRIKGELEGLREAEATIARVRTLHARCEGHTRDCDDCLGRNDICSWCGDPYPCPTIAAIDQPGRPASA